MSTDLVVTEQGTVLFAGDSPEERIVQITAVADSLNEIIMQRKLFTQISGRRHIQIEAWQTLGTLTGVFAIKDGGLRELPWPVLAGLGDAPEDRRTATYGAWEQHRTLLAQRDVGRAYGFSAAYKAVKDGREVGWGEGRCCRGEKTWVGRDDFALASMAQTRGQSRTLKQPLGFIVHLAGFATTPAEELAEPAPASPYGVLTDAGGDAQAAQIIDGLFDNVDGSDLVRIVIGRFETEHLPDAAAKMVAAIQWAVGESADMPDPDAAASDGAPPDGNT